MDFIKNWFNQVKEIVIRPREFFQRMPTETRSLEHIRFAMFTIFVGSFLADSFRFIMDSEFQRNFWMSTITGNVFLEILMFSLFKAAIAGSIGVALISAIYHALLKMVGAKNSFDTTCKVVAYATVFSLYMWIPVVGIIFALYMLYVTIIGFSLLHGISMKSAAIPVVVVLILIIFYIGIEMMSYMQYQKSREDNEALIRNFIDTHPP